MSVSPPVLGRASPAADAPARLRAVADGSLAAYRADGGEHGGWSLRAASVAGVRHRLAGTGPEDAYAWACGPGWVAAAVADGVSGERGSAVAAHLAARAACDALVGALAEGGEGEAAPAPRGVPWNDRGERDGTSTAIGGAAGWRHEACREAVAAANRAVEGAGSGATTIVVVIAAGSGELSAARVGDSTALQLAGGVWSEIFASGDGDDLVATATAALPHPDPPIELADVTLAPSSTLLLVTDGIADPLRDGPTTVAPAFASLLAAPPPPLALAELVDFSRQGCHDDRTLLGLWWDPEAAGPGEEVGTGHPVGEGDPGPADPGA